MEFLTSKELGLNPAGYLISTTSKKPVSHAKFEAEQRAAEYIVKLAEATVGKSFKAAKVDSFAEISMQVQKAIQETTKTTYVEVPAKPKSALVDELVNFAMSFEGYNEDKQVAEKINQVMQEYNTIYAIENIGDYFSEGLVKLSKIYAIEEILAAVKQIASIAK